MPADHPEVPDQQDHDDGRQHQHVPVVEESCPRCAERLATVEEVHTAEETLMFALPPELRRDMKAARLSEPGAAAETDD